METLSFLLGISAVLIVIGVAVVFSMYRKLNQHTSNLESLEDSQRETIRDYNDKIDQIHRRIDIENERLGRIQDKIYQDIDEYSSNLHSIIDSRLDKLENKISTKFSKK